MVVLVIDQQAVGVAHLDPVSIFYSTVLVTGKRDSDRCSIKVGGGVASRVASYDPSEGGMRTMASFAGTTRTWLVRLIASDSSPSPLVSGSSVTSGKPTA